MACGMLNLKRSDLERLERLARTDGKTIREELTKIISDYLSAEEDERSDTANYWKWLSRATGRRVVLERGKFRLEEISPELRAAFIDAMSAACGCRFEYDGKRIVKTGLAETDTAKHYREIETQFSEPQAGLVSQWRK